MAAEKIDVLLKEHDIMHGEVTDLLKNIYNCLFSFLASLGLFIGLAVSLLLKDKTTSIDVSYYVGLTAFFVSQIEFTIVVFSMSMLADVFAKSAYIGYIERKINFLLEEKTVFWESEVASHWGMSGKKLTKLNINAVMLSHLVLFMVYAFAFVLFSLYANSHVLRFRIPFICIQAIELLIIAILSFQISNERKRSAKFINDIQSK